MKIYVDNILKMTARVVSRHRLLRPVPLLLLSMLPCAKVIGSGLGYILEPVTIDDVPNAYVDEAEMDDAVPAAEAPAVEASGRIAVDKPKPKPVAKKAVYINDRDILDALASALHDHYRLEGELRVSLQHKWKPTKVPSEDWVVNINELPMNGVQSSIILKFEVIEGNITVGQWQLPIRCELWKEVLTSTRRIANGVEPLASDFEIKQVNVLRLNDNPVPVTIDLNNYVMKQAIGNAQPLLWQNIEPKPLVRKGQLVEVIAAEGALHITMKGVALEDGLLNDFISIRNLTSKKSFDAQIIDEKHVKVYF